MKLNEVMGRRQNFRHDDAPKGYTVGKVLRGNRLHRGQKVAASYNQFNSGTDFVEILGVTSNRKQYGDGGVRYNSVKEALQVAGVRSLKELEEVDNKNEYGFGHYLCTKDLPDPASNAEPTSGCFYYLFEGRWARGSGAEKLSFRELVPAQEDSFDPLVPAGTPGDKVRAHQPGQYSGFGPRAR